MAASAQTGLRAWVGKKSPWASRYQLGAVQFEHDYVSSRGTFRPQGSVQVGSWVADISNDVAGECYSIEKVGRGRARRNAPKVAVITCHVTGDTHKIKPADQFAVPAQDSFLRRQVDDTWHRVIDRGSTSFTTVMVFHRPRRRKQTNRKSYMTTGVHIWYIEVSYMDHSRFIYGT